MTDPDMKCGTGIFPFWFSSDATISAEDTNFMEQEEFADSAFDWLKQLYGRIKDSLKLARIQYGARPKPPNVNDHRSNPMKHMNEEGNVKMVLNNPVMIQKAQNNLDNETHQPVKEDKKQLDPKCRSGSATLGSIRKTIRSSRGPAKKNYGTI